MPEIFIAIVAGVILGRLLDGGRRRGGGHQPRRTDAPIDTTGPTRFRQRLVCKRGRDTETQSRRDTEDNSHD